MISASLLDRTIRLVRTGLKLLASQPRYRLLTGVVAFLLFFGALSGRYSSTPKQEIGIPYAGPRNAVNAAAEDDHGFLPLDKAKDFCERRRWEVYNTRDQRRKIYDMFLINTELDWLEIRLHELEAQVDYFVILESNITFQNRQKPLYFQDDLKDSRRPWDNFRSKIIHHVVDFSHAKLDDDNTWAHEHFTRNALLTQALRSLPEGQAPSQGDVLLIGDIDEIPRLSALEALRNCAFPPRVTLRSHFYYYSFQWLHRGEQWPHPQATFFNGLEDTIQPEDLRLGNPHAELYNAAWHCSSCFPSMADMKNKITSFSHKAYNHPYILDDQKLLQKVRTGRDIFERKTEIFDRVDNNPDVPEYLKQDHNKKYDYLLNRDPPNANFADLEIL